MNIKKLIIVTMSDEESDGNPTANYKTHPRIFEM